MDIIIYVIQVHARPRALTYASLCYITMMAVHSSHYIIVLKNAVKNAFILLKF